MEQKKLTDLDPEGVEMGEETASITVKNDVGLPIEIRGPATPVVRTAPDRDDPNYLVELAMTSNVSADTMERLVALAERAAEAKAKQEFSKAIGMFQRDCPVIRKARNVHYNEVNYDFAPLDYIVATVRPHLNKHGLSFSFSQTYTKTDTTVHTTIRHIGGHSETSDYSCTSLAGNSKMSDMHRNASATSYAKRYGLCNALGIICGNEDDDGNAAGTEMISDEQAANIDALISEVGADEKRFLAYMGVDQVGHISKAKYTKAVRALEDKRRSAR